MNIASKLLFTINSIMGLLILVIPAAFIVLPDVGELVVLMLIFSILGLVIDRDRLTLEKWEKFFIFSFIFYFVNITINLWWFDGYLRDLDTPSRLVLILPIFFFIRKSKIDIKWFIWSMPIAALTVGVNQIMIKFYHSGLYVFHDGLGIVTLYSSIFGAISLFCLNKNKDGTSNLIFFIGALIGIFGSTLSGGRGVWISAFLSFVLMLILNPMGWKKSVKLFISITFVSIFIVSYLIPQTGVQDRANSAISNTASWVESGNALSSVGARLEMWSASFDIIKNNLLIGIGEDNYNLYQQELIKQGKISKDVGAFLHPHQEYLSNLVEQGIVGLLAFLFVLFAPLRYFLYYARSNQTNHELKMLSAAGMIIIMYYAFYSVTSGVFDHQLTTLFYSLYIAIIAGLIRSGRDTG